MERKYYFTLLFSFGAGITMLACKWQLMRKQWKEDLLKERNAYLDLLPFKVSLPLAENDWNYRPVKLVGKFDHSKEMHMLRNYGGLVGYKILTPFYLAENQGFIVQRGWVPGKFKNLETREEKLGEVEISGVFKKGDTPGKLTPDNIEVINEWHYADLKHMAQRCGLKNEEAENWMVQEINWDRNREVYEGEDLPEIPVRSVRSELMYFTIMPFNHATYATFWFFSSVICSIFSIIALKKF